MFNSLGLPHDRNSIDTKPGDGLKYIMLPHITNLHNIAWSPGSRNRMERLGARKDCLRDYTGSKNFDVYAFDNSYYHSLPGREWTAKAQCEVYLRDKDANVVTLYDICRNLQCETPQDDTYYFTAPALDGTSFILVRYCSYKFIDFFIFKNSLRPWQRISQRRMRTRY